MADMSDMTFIDQKLFEDDIFYLSKAKHLLVGQLLSDSKLSSW